MVRMPLGYKIANRIVDRIRGGEWQAGEQIPSEDELARQLGVSRNTVREAIAQLIQEGYLIKRHGIGTFVKSPEAITSGLESLTSITQLIEEQGYRPGVRNIEIIERQATEEERIRLAAWKNDFVIELHRVRTADDRPILYCIDVFPQRFAPASQGELGQSLFSFLESHYYQVAIFARTEIEVVAAPKPIADLLEIAPQAPLLCLNQAHYNQNSTLLLLSKDHFVPGTFRFDVVRHRH